MHSRLAYSISSLNSQWSDVFQQNRSAQVIPLRTAKTNYILLNHEKPVEALCNLHSTVQGGELISNRGKFWMQPSQ